MPPIDLPRGNSAKVTPRPRSAYVNPPAKAPAPQPAAAASALQAFHSSEAASYKPSVQRANQAIANRAIASAPSAPRRSDATSQLATAIAGITRYATSHPFAPIATYGPRNAQPLAKLRLQAQLAQVYQRLQAANLLPAEAKEPSLSVVPMGGPGAYTDVSGGGGHIYYSPEAAIAATSPSSGSEYAWALEGLVHELAHTMQSPRTRQSIPLREGGAQAYADAATPRVLGPLAENDSNYSGYVQQVLKKKGPAWYMRGQFGG